jgi:hypothetical protein
MGCTEDFGVVVLAEGPQRLEPVFLFESVLLRRVVLGKLVPGDSQHFFHRFNYYAQTILFLYNYCLGLLGAFCCCKLGLEWKRMRMVQGKLRDLWK